MQLDIISQRPEDAGRTFRQYQVEGIPTIGVFGDEPFAIRFRNSSAQRVQVKLSLDGTDVLSGQLATLDPHTRMWVVNGHASMELEAWPESHRGGARFVFATVDQSVAFHTHGDFTAKGFISAAVFEEGAPPPPTNTVWGRAKGGVYRGALESFRSDEPLRGGPAIGAGSYVEQYLASVQGLGQPTFSQLIQIRYLWWDDLVVKLRADGILPTPIYPTGFHGGGRLADLGNTPRIATDHPSETGYARFK